MSDPIVYRSHDPEVVQAWTGASNAISDYIDRTRIVLKEAGVGGYQTYRDTGSWKPGRFRGLAVPQDEFPPAGWRIDAQHYNNLAVPDKRTKAGKQAASALDAIEHPGDPLFKLIGMPPDIESGTGFSSPGVRLLEDGAALYVGWRSDPEGRESFFKGKVRIDHDRWQRVPLSQYYAEVERKDTAKAEAGVSA